MLPGKNSKNCLSPNFLILLSASCLVKIAFRTYQHVINKFLSFSEDKLWLLQSTGF